MRMPQENPLEPLPQNVRDGKGKRISDSGERTMRDAAKRNGMRRRKGRK